MIVADTSEKYKLWYKIWRAKQAKKIIDDAKRAGTPPPSLADAEIMVTNDPDHEKKWMASDIYKKQLVKAGRIPEAYTTTDRFTTSVMKQRSAEIMKENPKMSEEEATKRAQSDVEKRQVREEKQVAGSKDPIAAKILTNISSILMDISENVVAIKDSVVGESALSAKDLGDSMKGLDAAEKEREKAAPKEKSKVAKAIEPVLGFFESLSKLFSVVLIPLFLGFLSKFLDLSKPLEAFIAGLIAIIGAFAAKSLASKLLSSVRGQIAGNVAARVPTTVPTRTPPIGGVPGGPAPVPSPGTGTAGAAAKPISALTTVAKGIKDLGIGIGAAIRSFMVSFAQGIAAFANPKTIGGIAVLTGATAAIGGLALLFKKGDINPEDFLAVGAGLVTLAGGLWALSRATPAAIAIAAAIKPLAIAAGVIALLGAALIPGAYAFTLFGEALKSASEGTEKIIDNLFRIAEIDAVNLAKVGAALIAVGAGFAAFNLAMMAGVAGNAMQAVAGFFGVESPMASLLNFVKDAADLEIGQTARDIDQLTRSLIKLNSLELENIGKIGEGLQSLAFGLGAFSVANVASGVSNLVTNLLNKAIGQESPLEQIQKISKDSVAIRDVGVGIESLGKGLVAFNAIDPDKIAQAMEYLDSLDEAQLQRLSRVSAVGTQPAQTQQLNQANQEVRAMQTPSGVPTQSTAVQQNNINNSSVNYSGNRMGSAVQGDALAAAR